MSRVKGFILSGNMSITIVLMTIVMLLLFSCGGSQREMGEAITERDSLPVMQTIGITSLISDSGITRYRIEAEEWLVYDRKKPSYWAFKKGVYLEKFDSLFNIDASVKADTAYYYDKQKLWKLVSDVHIQNFKGEKYDTDLLYWDQTTKKLYSDKLIRIEQADRIIIGYGFESDQQMNKPVINNIEGVFYINKSAPTDSIN
jgi:LPS export ABC transporter protein LptC